MDIQKRSIPASVDQRIAQAEKMRKGRETAIQPKLPVCNLNCVDALNYERSLYIDEYCNELIRRDIYHDATVKVIRECMEKYNVRLDMYLVDNNTFNYSFNATLIYMMVASGLFSTDDYYKVGKIEVSNAFHALEIFEHMKKSKKR